MIKNLLRRYWIQLGNVLRGARDTNRRGVGVSNIASPLVDVKEPTFIDTSHHDPPYDWYAIPKTVILFGTKATEGDFYRDPTFPEHFEKARDILGIRRLAYHFYRNDRDPVRQADWFLNYIDPYITDDDILCLDFEEGGEKAPKLWAFHDRVLQRRPNNVIWNYSRNDLMNVIIMNASEKAFFRTIPSWVAGYPYNPNPYTTTPNGYKPDPEKWGPVWAWQYSPEGQVAGWKYALDLNLMEKPLLDYLEASGETPPPTGEPMAILYKADLKAGAESNVRVGAGMGYSVLEKLAGPLTVDIVSEKTTNVYNWYQISAPVKGWIALTTSYENFRVAEPEPPTGERPTIQVHQVFHADDGRPDLTVDSEWPGQ